MQRRDFHLSVLLGLATTALGTSPQALLAQPAAGNHERLIVHEWGTFTSLQDEAGRVVPGINTDEEALPEFVHRLANHLVVDPTELAPIYYKGVPRVHQDVTMRLETPVIYFYPPANASQPMEIDLRVQFRGGWLTEYYPNATVSAPGLAEGNFRFGQITPKTLGELSWNQLRIGGNPPLPTTNSPIWLAPRLIGAASVQNAQGEGERYVFYRGVGHLNAPLRVTRDTEKNELTVSEYFEAPLIELQRPFATKLWLADIRPDGSLAYRAVDAQPFTMRPGHVMATLSARFEEQDYSRDHLLKLREELRQAIIADGMYPDEAEALLNTWRLGYFQSPGQRLFFLLPQQWTDAILPLDVSVPAEIRRTMVGRIELVTPRHRELLGRISQGPVSEAEWFWRALEADTSRQDNIVKAVWEGRAALADAKLTPPSDYLDYLALGRFRNALVLDAQGNEKNSGLQRFAEAYHISYFRPR